MSFVNRAVAPPVVLQEDLGKLVVKLLQSGKIGLIGVDLFGTPVQLNHESWALVGLVD